MFGACDGVVLTDMLALLGTHMPATAADDGGSLGVVFSAVSIFGPFRLVLFRLFLAERFIFSRGQASFSHHRIHSHFGCCDFVMSWLTSMSTVMLDIVQVWAPGVVMAIEAGTRQSIYVCLFVDDCFVRREFWVTTSVLGW
jgi:hypothetical protein